MLNENKESHLECESCKRIMANFFDEGVCNTGECGCAIARSLCWKRWNNNQCTTVSIYDPEAAKYNQ